MKNIKPEVRFVAPVNQLRIILQKVMAEENTKMTLSNFSYILMPHYLNLILNPDSFTPYILIPAGMKLALD